MARYLFVTICLLVGLASAGINDAVAGKRVALVIGNEETIFWQSVEKRGDIADYQIYLRKYPDGHFADLAKNRLASLQRAKTEQRAATERRRREEEAPRRKELMESERKNPRRFWETVTRRDAELLVSDTRPGNWPVFTLEYLGAGQSRLHLAAWGGNKDVVRLLLERGADIGVRDEGQGTPLHNAAKGGNKDVARLLLERGAESMRVMRVRPPRCILWLRGGIRIW